MDPERHDELLTAYLDRELPPDERAAVDRLLENSTEARQRLHELETTSRFMRNLPRCELDASFADSVVHRLERESLLRPEPVVPKRTSHRWGTWVGGSMAAAASLLLAIWGLRDLNKDNPRNPAPDTAAGWNSAPLSPELEVRRSDFATETGESLVPDLVVVPDQLRAGDAFTIMNEQRTKQVVLMVLDRPNDGRNLIHGILFDENTLFKTDVHSKDADADDSNRPSVTTVVADASDVEKMLEAVKQSAAQNSLPIVDVSFGGLEEFMGEGAIGEGAPAPLLAKDGQSRKDQTSTATRGIVPERRFYKENKPSAGNKMPPAAAPPSSSTVALQATPKVNEEKNRQEFFSKLQFVPFGSGLPLVLPELSEANLNTHIAEAETTDELFKSRQPASNRPGLSGGPKRRVGVPDSKGSNTVENVEKLGRDREPGRARVVADGHLRSRPPEKEKEARGRLHVLLQIGPDPDRGK